MPPGAGAAGLGVELPLSEVGGVAGGALVCIAGLSGAPQISLPLGTVDGLPVGLSLMAAPGQDELLIEIARSAPSPSP